MIQGVVQSINLDRGFGFVRPAGKGADLFFHFTTLQDGLSFDDSLRQRRVECVIEEAERGPRCKAVFPVKG